MKEISREFAKEIAAQLKRKADSYKNDYGKVLVVAGSSGMAGAAVLCGRSALKTGSGLVKYSIPDEIRDVLQIAVPEATCLPRELKVFENNFDAVAFGPGLGFHKSDKEVLNYLLTEYNGTIVLDADGLNDIIRFHLEYELSNSKAQIIITPHEGEAARLLRIKKIENREQAAIELTEKYNVVTVLKGHETLICLPKVDSKGEAMYINRETGNPGMATGGSGDVLTGIIASLLGQGLENEKAAILGVFIHGVAGDICANDIGQSGMTAGDICEKIPKVLKDII